MAAAPPARAALDFPVFRTFHEITAHLTPIPASRRWETTWIYAQGRQRMGPALPDAAAPAPFAIRRAVPLSAKAEPFPMGFYSIPSGNTARYRDQRPGSNRAAEPRGSPPPPGPAEHRAELPPASASSPAPPGRATPPCVPAAPPRPSLPPSPPPGGGRARPPGARGRCGRGGWRRGAVRKGGGRGWGRGAGPLSPCRLGGCAGR